MPILEDEYTETKRTVVALGQNISSSNLQLLIEEFDSVINSRRRSSYIRNCDDLITILEKRGHINHNSYVLPLTKIVNRLPATDEKRRMLARLSSNTEHPRVAPWNASNRYAQRQPTHQFSGIDHSSVSQRASSHPGILPDSVLELLSEEIGNKWRDLARRLNLKEGDINRIRLECNNDSVQCIYQSLLLYQSRSDPVELEKNLLSALEKTRRTDLRNQVHTLLDRRDF